MHVLTQLRMSALTPSGGAVGGCGQVDYKGDGSCDDQNNDADCDYDGGDCCGADVVTDYCEQCACNDPGISRTQMYFIAGILVLLWCVFSVGPFPALVTYLLTHA